MPQTVPISVFDYSKLDTQTAHFIQKQTGEIRVLMRRTAQDIFEIGQKLIEVKKKLGHGHFLAWLEAEFAWTERTARRFMKVAEQFGTKLDTLSDLDMAPTALYLLAAPSTPETAREEALALAQAGEPITQKTAQQIKQKHTALSTQSKLRRTREEKPSPQETSSFSSPTQEVIEAAKFKGEILAIRPPKAVPENTIVMSEQTDTSSSTYQKSKFVEPGTWWQLGEHLFYCGSPTSARFKERLPQDIALSLAFPANQDWNLAIPSQAKSTLVLLASDEREPELQDLILLREAIERFLDLYTEPKEIVVFSFLPDPELLRLAHEFDCLCFIAEPDAARCEAAIAAWRRAGEKAEKVTGLRF